MGAAESSTAAEQAAADEWARGRRGQRAAAACCNPPGGARNAPQPSGRFWLPPQRRLRGAPGAAARGLRASGMAQLRHAGEQQFCSRAPATVLGRAAPAARRPSNTSPTAQRMFAVAALAKAWNGPARSGSRGSSEEMVSARGSAVLPPLSPATMEKPSGLGGLNTPRRSGSCEQTSKPRGMALTSRGDRPDPPPTQAGGKPGPQPLHARGCFIPSLLAAVQPQSGLPDNTNRLRRLVCRPAAAPQARVPGIVACAGASSAEHADTPARPPPEKTGRLNQSNEGTARCDTQQHEAA